MHRLREIDAEKRTAVCEECGPVEARLKSQGAGHAKLWRCITVVRRYSRTRSQVARVAERAARHAEKQNGKVSRRGLRGLVDLSRCTRCGFVPEDIDDPVELDIHHEDGDRSNSSPDNLRVLCANCHRRVERLAWLTLGRAWGRRRVA